MDRGRAADHVASALVDADATSATAAVLDIRQDSRVRGRARPRRRCTSSSATSPTHADDVPTGPTVVMCGHGERAMGAASLLARAGHTDVAVLDGGPEDWAEATGQRLETGP